MEEPTYEVWLYALYGWKLDIRLIDSVRCSWSGTKFAVYSEWNSCIVQTSRYVQLVMCFVNKDHSNPIWL